MKSFTGNSPSVRGWALLLALLLGAGMMISACGEEETPAPTTPTPPPAPPPAPEPEPTPEPPATPTGLHVDSANESSITWHWNAVEGAVGYVVQAGMDETWDATDTVSFDGVPFTTETQYTATGLDPETTMYVRVAAAAGTPAAPLVSDFSTHVTGMTTAVALAPAPANLKVKTRGSDFIEWVWDAVEGVAGYQSQFSTTSTFAEGSAGREWHDADVTTRRVSNLDAESDGYLRVRTYAGTQAEPTFGAWSAGNMGETDVLPAAVRLTAPTGLEADDRDADSITLVWDRVRNAGSYLVEQREPGDADWGDARCEGGDNEVEDEECVASGLTAGTDYDFRVSAVPSDTDRYLTSQPSDILESRTLGTAPRTPTTPTTGGMGDLNVEWESATASITFLWDRVADAEYESAELTTYSDDPKPCESVTTWADQGRSTSQVVSSGAATTDDPMVRGLCVRTKDESNRALSFAWGVPTPLAPTAGSATVEDGKTTSLPWTGINVARDFNYAVRLVADTGRNDGKFSSAAPPTDALQKACADGMLRDDGVADLTLTGLTETVDKGIKHFTGYTLCLQYSNDSGATDWAVPVASDNLNEIHTTPAAPPAPRFDRGTNNAGGTERTLEWTVAVRNSTDVPREHGGFEAKIIHYPVRYDHDTDTSNSLVTTPHPTAKTCGNENAEPSNLKGGTNPWDRTATTSLGTSLEGVTVTSSAIGIQPNTGQNLNVRLCVRAIRSSAGGTDAVNGPWRIGGATTITKQAPPF